MQVKVAEQRFRLTVIAVKDPGGLPCRARRAHDSLSFMAQSEPCSCRLLRARFLAEAGNSNWIVLVLSGKHLADSRIDRGPSALSRSNRTGQADRRWLRPTSFYPLRVIMSGA